MILNLFGINTLNKKLQELEDKNYEQYCENNRLKKQLEAKELDLKIAQMYIDDDDALLELFELSKNKSEPESRLRAALGAGYGQTSQQALMAQQMDRLTEGGFRNANIWGGM